MPIDYAHSFLVHAGKGLIKPPVPRGTAVDKTATTLFAMLEHLFTHAERECRHAVAFQSSEPSKQVNDCLDDILDYALTPSLPSGRKLAQRLQRVTLNQSGLGLLFLLAGTDRGIPRLVISRFPAQEGILAEEGASTLTVTFLEKIFMKSSTSYKAATFAGKSPKTDFWKGRSVDKQLNDPDSTISNYWIRDFLQADFLTPGELGSRRFAQAVRKAISGTKDLALKDELSAACKLIPSFDKKAVSAGDIVRQLGISIGGQDAIKSHFPKERLFEEPFRFVAREANLLLAFKTIELNNGGLMTALADEFDSIFERHRVQHKDNVYRFSTEGTVIDQRFRKSKGQ
jgi:hypothetical protein